MNIVRSDSSKKFFRAVFLGLSFVFKENIVFCKMHSFFS